MKFLKIIFLFLFCNLSAQKTLPFDSLKLKDATDFLVDDYRNIFLYKNKDFSFTKYDSLGKQQAKMMMTLPFKIQSVQNPMNIVLFSENTQEMKFVDANLNEIQKVDFRQKFGFIKSAYAEDLQQIWLLDESMKRLVQYNFRANNIINSFPFFIDFEKIKDMLVFENRLYLLTENDFKVYNFKAEKIFETKIDKARKLRRENENIFVIAQNSVSKYSSSNQFTTTFTAKNSKIVDKNSSAYFEIKAGKLYLYQLE